MTISIPFILLLVLLVAGMLIWFIATPGSKTGEAGKLMFFCALLALCFQLAAPHLAATRR